MQIFLTYHILRAQHERFHFLRLFNYDGDKHRYFDDVILPSEALLPII